MTAPKPPKMQVRGISFEGRVFIDLVDLVEELRRRARWWLNKAELTGKGPDDELTDEEYQLVLVGSAIAAELEDRADQFDVQGMAFVTDYKAVT